MFVVPILSYNRDGTDLTHFWVFLERNGTHLIEIDATPETAVDAATNFLSLNGLPYMDTPIVAGDLIFAQIDPKSKDLASFYTWREISQGTTKEVWRPFLWLSNRDNTDPFGVNKLLDNISLGQHNAYSVVSSYLKTCC
jgi:hypothetical protein